jgi:hypothetical protein
MMKRIAMSLRWSLPFVIIAFVCTEGEPTPLPAEGEGAVGDKVQVQENPGSITLSNGLVTITLNKKTAQLTSLKAGKKGELLGGGGRDRRPRRSERADVQDCSCGR